MGTVVSFDAKFSLHNIFWGQIYLQFHSFWMYSFKFLGIFQNIMQNHNYPTTELFQGPNKLSIWVFYKCRGVDAAYIFGQQCWGCRGRVNLRLLKTPQKMSIGVKTQDRGSDSCHQKGKCQVKIRAILTNFHGRHSKWHRLAESTCLQEHYLPMKLSRTGVLWYHNVQHLL